MADKRKVFPVEKVLELVTGKEGANVKEIAGYVLGETVDCGECARAAGPFAAAWLSRWYPRFVDLVYKEGDSWGDFVKQGARLLGDHVSITPMDGNAKAHVNATLNVIRDTEASLKRQAREAMDLEKRIKELEPLEGALAQAKKKNDELEAKIKSMKADMVALQRKAAEFQGKMPVDQEELMDTIKSAIKDGLKGVAIASAATPAGEAAPAAEAAEEEEAGFGFGTTTNSDGFGF